MTLSFPRTLVALLLISACSPGISSDPGTDGGSGGGTTPGTGGATSGSGGAPGSSGGATTPGSGGAPVSSGGRSGSTGGASAGTGGAGSGGRVTGTGGATTSTGGRATGGAAAGTGGAGTAGATGTAGAPGTAGMTGSSGGAGGGGARTAEATCARWKADRTNLSEGTWSGSLTGCVVGDISADGRENALRLFNLYRWLADMPPVVTEATRNMQAQACALMMDANNMLSHSPPTTWTCYTADGATGASQSNISSGPGVSSVQGYMVDTGNETTFGHRRIVLSNKLGPIGLGSTGPGGASCMQNITGNSAAGKMWVAWPPPGPFPTQAYGSSGRGLSQTGWSVQTQTKISLTAATVSVTMGGTNMPMTVSQLTGQYGESNAIRMVPMGWDVAAGQSYTVTVSGVSIPISYTVDFVSCP